MNYALIFTNIGKTKIATALANNTQINLLQVIYGDGNGSIYEPDDNMSNLKREVYRANIINKKLYPSDNTIIMLDAVIPIETGGFTIREVGIIDADNELIAIAAHPEVYKPLPSENSASEMKTNIKMRVSDINIINLTMPSSVTMATVDYVDDVRDELIEKIESEKTDINEQIDNIYDAISNTSDAKLDEDSIDTDLVTSITYSNSDGTLKTTLNVYNPVSEETNQSELTPPLADEEHDGIMSKNDVNAIRANTARIASLEGASKRYPLHLGTDPLTQDEYQSAFEQVANVEADSVPPNGATLVNLDNNHAITYFANAQGDKWIDRGSDTVSQADNNGVHGTITGSTADGQIYIETDGKGSVNGWSALKTRVTNNETNITNKEPKITAGTSLQYYRGDKTWATLDKSAVGLGNVDNTSDANKPISTTTQNALNNKQNINEGLGFKGSIAANTDIDTILTAGAYATDAGSTGLINMPPNASIYGLLEVQNYNVGNRTKQTYTDAYGSWVRFKTNNAGSFAAWQKVDERQKVYYATTATAIGTAAKVIDGLATDYIPAKGDVLNIYMQLGNNVTTPTLDIFGTVYPLQFRDVNLTASANYSIPAKQTISVVFNGTAWQFTINPDWSDDNTLSQLHLGGNTYQAGAAVTKYHICMEGIDGKMYEICTGDTNAATKTASTQVFKPGGTIIWYSGSSTKAANAYFGTDGNVHWYYNSANVNYAFNGFAHCTGYRTLYLKGQMKNNGFVLDNTSTTSWYTTELPASEDGYVYIKLGVIGANTATIFTLLSDHPAVEYRNGKVRPYCPIKLVLSGSNLTITED